MTPALTVVGESLVDVVDDAGSTVTHPGGSPLNVAVGLARLGLPTRFISEIGRDDDGGLLLRHLEGAGVIVDGIHRVARTSRATAVLNADGAARYSFDLEWTLDRVSSASGPVLHTGSIGAWLEPGASTVLGMLRARERGTIASVDANIRPSLIGEHRQAVARIAELFAAADIAKLSDEDAAWLYPGESKQRVLDRLLAAGCQLAVLTRGARGASLASAAARVSVDAAPTVVADTIGAGDSFTAGMLAHVAASGLTAEELSAGLDADSLRALGSFAARCAGITVGRPGADPPTALEVGGLPQPRVSSS